MRWIPSTLEFIIIFGIVVFLMTSPFLCCHFYEMYFLFGAYHLAHFFQSICKTCFFEIEIHFTFSLMLIHWFVDKSNSARKISIEIETRFYLWDKKKMFVIQYHQDLKSMMKIPWHMVYRSKQQHLTTQMFCQVIKSTKPWKNERCHEISNL